MKLERFLVKLVYKLAMINFQVSTFVSKMRLTDSLKKEFIHDSYTYSSTIYLSKMVEMFVRMIVAHCDRNDESYFNCYYVSQLVYFCVLKTIHDYLSFRLKWYLVIHQRLEFDWMTFFWIRVVLNQQVTKSLHQVSVAQWLERRRENPQIKS